MQASYSNIISKLRSSISFNNTTTPPLNQQPPMNNKVVELSEVSAPIATSGNTTGDNHAQDDSQLIAEQVQSISIATLAGTCTLLVNLPEDIANRCILCRMYLFPLWISFVGSPLLFFISKTTPSPGGAWLQKMILRVVILSFIISVTLKIFSLLSTPIEWYDVLVPLLLLGVSSLYLWYGWIKANDSAQTSTEDIRKSIAKEVQPFSIAVEVASCCLLANPLKYEHNQHVQYRLFLLFLLFSFGSTAALVYIPKTTLSPGDAWLQKQALKTAIVSLIISGSLRIFLPLTPIEWYKVLISFVVIAVSSLYLWYGWNKANNSAQESNSEETNDPAQMSSSVLAGSDEAV